MHLLVAVCCVRKGRNQSGRWDYGKDVDDGKESGIACPRTDAVAMGWGGGDFSGLTLSYNWGPLDSLIFRFFYLGGCMVANYFFIASLGDHPKIT